MRLNYGHLYYFYVAAMEGSIKAAAERLHVSQPTVSDQIKALESSLGVTLFERRNRSIFLTRDGDIALEHASRIFDEGDAMVSRLRSSSPKVSFDIGVSLSMSQYLIYDRLLPLFEEAGIQIKVREKERHLLLAELETGHLDMVFTDARDSVGKNMVAYPIGINRTFAVAHRTLCESTLDVPACLNGKPFFNYTADSFLHYEIGLFFAKSGITPKQAGEADDIDLLELVTVKGIAFTIVPEAAVKRFQIHSDIQVLGEIKDFQSTVYGIIGREDRGVAYRFLQDADLNRRDP